MNAITKLSPYRLPITVEAGATMETKKDKGAMSTYLGRLL